MRAELGKESCYLPLGVRASIEAGSVRRIQTAVSGGKDEMFFVVIDYFTD